MGGAAKTVNKRSDVIKFGDQLLADHGAQWLDLRSDLWGREASCLGKAMVQRHQTPLQFDETTVVVHQSPPKNARKKNRTMELVSICQDSGLQLRLFISRMLKPRCSSMQFSNGRFVLQRHFSSQDQHWEVIQESWQCLRMFYLDPGTILNQGRVS